jgi:hypothetical protein
VSDQSQTSPDTVLGVLTKTASISARYFVPLWAISAIFVLPVSLLFDLLVWAIEHHWRNTDLASIIDWIGFACTSIAMTFCSFLIVSEVTDICLGGTTSFSKAIRRTSTIGVVRLFGTNVIVWALMAIAFFVVPIVLFFLGLIVRLIDATAPPNIASLIIVGSIAAALTMVPFLFTDQIVVIERRYWISALKRSDRLVVRSKAASFGFALVVIALFTLPYVGADLLADGVVVSQLGDTDISESLGASIARSVMAAAFIPIAGTVLTVGYYHVKRRAGTDRDAATG